MRRTAGRITVRGVVQGVGFRPYVYATARASGVKGTVQNLGSEVEILAAGENFEEFLSSVRKGPPLSRIDSVDVLPLADELVEDLPEGFRIVPSREGSRTGMIPPDVATCSECLGDIDSPGGRYHAYWATSCVNCGPRYSIISTLPYDRERTSMSSFGMCPACAAEYSDPACRRHHAQTIACPACGPVVRLLDSSGAHVGTPDPVRKTAELLDQGYIVGIRGIGGFHVACTESAARELKARLGRVEQPFAVMARQSHVREIAHVSGEEDRELSGLVRPIVVLEKKDPIAHAEISNLHTIGCMLPYTGLHHLLFRHLRTPLLIMTSANIPGYPMITDIDHAMSSLHEVADFFLTHNRLIRNRCDDSVVRDGYIIRLSRGMAPLRNAIDLGDRCILGVGPELNANVTVYRDGICTTSPHVGNVRNPATFAYLEETIGKIGSLLDAHYDVIAHDLHPQFLSTRLAARLAEESGAVLVPVQHHRAHIAAVTKSECVGIAIDGVGYGDDGTVWGGEVFAGSVPDFERVGSLEPVPMPGGDLATRFPGRMLYGILPDPAVLELLSVRGFGETELRILERQVASSFNTPLTSSTGRVLDAAAALLGTCRERTYDGEPAMKLESLAYSGKPVPWDLEYRTDGNRRVLSTRALMREALSRLEAAGPDCRDALHDIAASFQFNLARGIADLAISAADDRGIRGIALSGGVAYNRAIRETIRQRIRESGHDLLINAAYPLGDGCISFGQCVSAGSAPR